MDSHSSALLSLLHAAQREDESGLFAFYEQLFRLRESYKATLSLPPYTALSTSLTTPLLQCHHLGIQEQPFFAWLTRIAELWERQDPGALDELEALSAQEVVEAGEKWYRTGSAGLGSVIDALLANAIAPYLERVAEAVQTEIPDKWRHSYCPICGGWADMAQYDEKKSRYRCICERCSTEWSIVRDACLFCGENDEERRGYYNSEDDLYRVLVCDNCGYYLKVINGYAARRMAYTPLLAAERLLTPGLDLTAAQEGYTRPTTLAVSLS
jgi:formate dehydrogenase maturation protein FdhE